MNLGSYLAGLAARLTRKIVPSTVASAIPSLAAPAKPAPKRTSRRLPKKARRKSRLFLKRYPEENRKLRAARRYKRTFKGISGALSWTYLTRRLHAGKLPAMA